jgi:hypothetical protein
LASKIPTLDACQHVAENHYKLVLVSGAISAQQHAVQSNAIAVAAVRPEPAPVVAPNIEGMVSVVNRHPTIPNIGGMSAMMGRYSGPVGPAPATAVRPNISGMAAMIREPSAFVLSAESLRRVNERWKAKRLPKLQEAWKCAVAVPYSGTAVRLTHDADASILPVITRAGMVASSVMEGVTQVYSSFENGKQAVAHVRRVLAEGGVKAQHVEAIGSIRRGRVAARRKS